MCETDFQKLWKWSFSFFYFFIFWHLFFFLKYSILCILTNTTEKIHLHTVQMCKFLYRYLSYYSRSYIEELCTSLYDIVRPLVIHMQHLETLSELCTVLRNEVQEQILMNRELNLKLFISVLNLRSVISQQTRIYHNTTYLWLFSFLIISLSVSFRRGFCVKMGLLLDWKNNTHTPNYSLE